MSDSSHSEANAVSQADGHLNGDPSQSPSAGHMLAKLSNAMVGIYKGDFGRGPTRSVSYFAGPDAIVCILRDSLTKAEQRLVEIGEDERMRETRLIFQHASEDKFRAAVEEVTGRKVESFVSGIDVHVDLSIEFFTLEPETNGDQSSG
ncbi:MAG: hypothetical protein QOF57_2210 [Frankiaceae bacterium]|jgi:uncharacterized protein YbcI|nr:hypothetical protein [Frankiaceae bacterium]